jgi:hypothetical protein
MHLLYCDETNLEKRDDDFFVYGGLVMSSDSAVALNNEIEKIRSTAQIPADFPLKFNPGPSFLDHAAFSAVKQRVIEAAIQANCILFTTMILHNIATSSDDARRNAINQLSYNFNDFLSCSKDYGLVLIDRFTDAQIDSHLREKFSIGITGLPYSPRVRLRRILGFHYAAIGQSHFGSVIDIVLGTLRFSVNAFCRNDLEKMARSRHLLAMLAPLLQKIPDVGERGPLTTKLSLDFTPKTIKAPMYKQRYEALRNYLAQNGIIAEQVIR